MLFGVFLFSAEKIHIFFSGAGMSKTGNSRSALLELSAGLVALLCASPLMGSLGLAGRRGPSARLALVSLASIAEHSVDRRTGVSPHSTMAGRDVRGRVTGDAGSSVALA